MNRRYSKAERGGDRGGDRWGGEGRGMSVMRRRVSKTNDSSNK